MKVTLCLLCLGLTCSAADSLDSRVASFRQTLGALVRANTSNPPGNEARAAEVVAARLKAEGVPYEIVEFAPGRANIVARLKAEKPQEKPLLLLAHLDVVGTKDQQWTSDPHTLTEKDGYLVGRGVSDDLGMATMELETFLALKRDRVPLRRDVILALTGDEESGGQGILYLLNHRPELIDAGIALNEGGGVELEENGKIRLVALQTAEKVDVDFSLVTHGTTGHSSVPLPDNAIFRLSRALDRLSHSPAPAHLVPVTRAYLAVASKFESGKNAAAMRRLGASHGTLPPAAVKQLEKTPSLSALLRTTCVATLVGGGSRENALPAEARANVNCRILPDETVVQVKQRLIDLIGDPGVDVNVASEMGVGGASPIDGEVPRAVKTLVHETWPGVPVVPVLSGGATDSRFLRPRGVAAYGIDSLALTETDDRRAHGIDERMPVSSLKPGLAFFDRLVRMLAREPRSATKS